MFTPQKMKNILAIITLIFILISTPLSANGLDDYKYTAAFHPSENLVTDNIQFNGYTNYWHDTYRQWLRYGNLYKISIPNIEYTIAQSKVDIAEDLQLPVLSMQKGFLVGLLTEQFISLDQPSIKTIPGRKN